MIPIKFPHSIFDAEKSSENRKEISAFGRAEEGFWRKRDILG
jgi:hypothetical protein